MFWNILHRNVRKLTLMPNIRYHFVGEVMEDFNYLHDNFKDSSRTHEKTTVVLVEDDRSLGISIKKYLEKVLSVEVIYFQSAHDCH